MRKRGFTLVELLIVVAIISIVLLLALSVQKPRSAPTQKDPLAALVAELAALAKKSGGAELVVYGDECSHVRLTAGKKELQKLPARLPPKELEPLAVDAFGNLAPRKLTPLAEANATYPVCFRYAADRWGFGSYGIYRLKDIYYYFEPFGPKVRRFESEQALLEALFAQDYLPLEGEYRHE